MSNQANSARGEADLEIAGQTHRVVVNMGALARLSSEIGAETFDELRGALFKLPNMPKVVAAVLAANGKQVSDADIAGMDWEQYLHRLIPAIFRSKPSDAEAGAPDAGPPKGQATTP
jgi:hypothetical protein